jgi:hypothetical protein
MALVMVVWVVRSAAANSHFGENRAAAPIAAGRRCNPRTHQSISHNAFAITASHKAFVTACKSQDICIIAAPLIKLGFFDADFRCTIPA